MVTLVNYGLGNIRAFENIYKRLNIPVEAATTVEQLAGARKLILPGVGSFDWAMTRLNESGLRDALDRRVLDEEVPVLGVCVGLQMMARGSEEGSLPGLGWINADVIEFTGSGDAEDLHLPHMGWNDVAPTVPDELFQGIDTPRYYFLHSYVVEMDRDSDVIAKSHYGRDFVAAARTRNILGTQFHPEKSHKWGIDLLRNFAEL